MPAELRRILLEACVLVALGSLIGLSLNYQLVLDAFAGRVAPPPRPAAQQPVAALPLPVVVDEVAELAAAGALLVDARAVEVYAEGHLAGAVSLPLGEIDERLPGFRQDVPPERTLVIYCSGFGCPDSFDLGLLLIAAGYRDVRVFEGGFPEWRDTGRPWERGAP